MAVSIMGYPQEVTFCPKCGNSNVETHDMWNQDGLTVCKSCGCRCYIIQAEEEGEE